MLFSVQTRWEASGESQPQNRWQARVLRATPGSLWCALQKSGEEGPGTGFLKTRISIWFTSPVEAVHLVLARI